MIGLDTNVLVRYFAQDDPVQSKQATELIESLSADSPGYVSQVALVELTRVLMSCYEVDRKQLKDVVESLLSVKEIVFEESETVRTALRTFAASTKCDFASCLVEGSGRVAGCEYTATFNKLAAKGARMRLLETGR